MQINKYCKESAACTSNHKKESVTLPEMYHQDLQTSDTQKGNSFHCTAENSIPIPNFLVWPKHILSATLAQFFRYLWFMPSLGVCSLWSRLKNSSVKVVYKQLVVVIHGNVKKQQKFFQISWIITKKHLVYKLRNSMDPKK